MCLEFSLILKDPSIVVRRYLAGKNSKTIWKGDKMSDCFPDWSIHRSDSQGECIKAHHHFRPFVLSVRTGFKREMFQELAG